jgi:prepilin-type N-terminal cleavage/methylation domain-containing protein
MASPNRKDMEERKTKKGLQKNSDGFTLIELLAILVIIGVIGSVGIKRTVAIEASAVQQSFSWAISELNTRETLSWSLVKLSEANWVDDLTLFASVDFDLGDYSWSSRTDSGGTLLYRGEQIELDRAPSTSSAPGRWKMK